MISNKPIVVIPARFGSKRLPGKPLALVHGRPMIVCVWERAMLIPGVEAVVVATDSEEIAAVVEKAGGWAVVSEEEYETGTDRVADIAKICGPERLVLNVQGDLPFFSPQVGTRLLRSLQEHPEADMATPVHIIRGDANEFYSPNVVKVGFDDTFKAVSFVRNAAPLPLGHLRHTIWYKHIGVYAYRNRALQALTDLPQTEGEQRERLEQLRALENGMHIRVVPVIDSCGQEVNTPEDLRKANGC